MSPAQLTNADKPAKRAKRATPANTETTRAVTSIPALPTAQLRAGREVGIQGARATYLSGFGAAFASSVPRAAGREPAILETLRILRDFDPDGSMAVWNVLRMANSGHSVEVKAPDGTRNPDAEKRLNDLAKRVWRDGGGGADGLCGVAFLSQYTYGGVGMEVVLPPALNDIKEVYPFGPMDIEFKPVPDADGDPVNVMFPARTIWNRDREPLNSLQTFYSPLDPDLDDPYGRPPMLPAVASLLAMQNLIKETIAVTQIHGYGMRDITISIEKIKANAPMYLLDDGQEDSLNAYINAVVDEITKAVAAVKATQTFVHTDNMTVGTTMPGGRGIDLGPVMQELSRRVITALKSMPLLLGQNEGDAQTHATVQWAIWVKGIKTVQQNVKRLLEAVYNLALRVWGIPGSVHLEFETIRETDRQIDANADSTEGNNAYNRFIWGLDDHKTFSNEVTGHDPTGPRPPTLADSYKLAVQQAEAAAQMSLLTGYSAPSPSDQQPSSTDAQHNPPGGDAGITAGEGAAVDAATSGSGTGTNLYSGARLLLDLPEYRVSESDIPDLGNDAAAVLGESIVTDTRDLLRQLAATDLLDLLDAQPEPVEEK